MPILAVGHYCHDTLLGNAGVHRALGGSAAYVSAILEALGEPHEVVAKVGADFLYGAEVSRKPLIVEGRTTAFVDDYRKGERTQRVEAVTPPIEPHEVQGTFDVGVACGIAGEVPLRTLRRLRQISRVVVADAQSILRVIGPGGHVALRPPEQGALECIDVLKASHTEASFLDTATLRRSLTLVFTEGPRGSRVIEREGETRIAAFAAKEEDPTGAGDCFLAGLAVGLQRGLPLGKAALLGSWFGARAVEHVGVPRLTREQARLGLEPP